MRVSSNELFSTLKNVSTLLAGFTTEVVGNLEIDSVFDLVWWSTSVKVGHIAIWDKN